MKSLYKQLLYKDLTIRQHKTHTEAMKEINSIGKLIVFGKKKELTKKLGAEMFNNRRLYV